VPDPIVLGMFSEIADVLDLPAHAINRVSFIGSGRLQSCFPVTELAAASISAACVSVSELLDLFGAAPPISTDYRLASLWFRSSIVPRGWKVPAPWDAIAGDYRAQDGWIKLHTNAPHHKAAALAVLGCEASRASVANAVQQWPADKLEQAIVGAGGCAAKLRSMSEWKDHPQGQAVALEPLVLRTTRGTTNDSTWQPTADRPLKGLRVLDLTRVLAGPVATRFLAGYGAQVLRIDPPGWDEPGVIPEVTPGKRCARLDLRDSNGRRVFERLLSQADILVHGYRADALERLGLGADIRQSIRPGLIDVSLDAYGHSGPWRTRRGFDSLVQFSSGIAAEGQQWRQSEAPVSLPVQALDHATGYLIAAAAVRGMIGRLRDKVSTQYRLSLARSAKLLCSYQSEPSSACFPDIAEDDVSKQVEATAWGPASRILPPALIKGAAFHWATPATALGSDQAEWKV